MIDRKERLEFAIETGCYFATLATSLDLMRQELQKEIRRMNKEDSALNSMLLSDKNYLARLRDDLMYLQREYCIVKKVR